MKLLKTFLVASIILTNMQIAFAGGSMSGTATVKLEPCLNTNLLILSEDHKNNLVWPYRVEEPSYCINIYDNTNTKIYYTLPKDSREETKYYEDSSSLQSIDALKNGEIINFSDLAVTGGDEYTDSNGITYNTYLITDILEPKITVTNTTTTNTVVPTTTTTTPVTTTPTVNTVTPTTTETPTTTTVTTTPTVTTTATTTRKIPIPPAGFEDEVITSFDEYKNPFTDTTLTTLAGKSAAELYRRAVIGGYADGEFKGEKAVNRAEAAKFLLLAKGESIDDSTKNNGKFPDVLDGQWYTKFVVAAEEKGIINGNEDGTFRPDGAVNTAEFLKMLTLTFNLEESLPHTYADVNTDDWFTKYAGIAKKYSLFPDRTSFLNPNDKLTREEVAIALYNFFANR